MIHVPGNGEVPVGLLKWQGHNKGLCALRVLWNHNNCLYKISTCICLFKPPHQYILCCFWQNQDTPSPFHSKPSGMTAQNVLESIITLRSPPIEQKRSILLSICALNCMAKLDVIVKLPTAWTKTLFHRQLMRWCYLPGDVISLYAMKSYTSPVPHNKPLLKRRGIYLDAYS